MSVKTAATSDEMVSLMTKGGYDLVTASGDASLRLIAGKRVQAINTDLIPNWKHLDPRLKDGPWYVVDAKVYGTPYQWGPNVLLYNTEVFKQAPTSWGVVFEPQDLPDGKPNKGRVQAYDGPIYIADAALYLKTAKPELGIDNPYELNETQYKAVLDLLRQQRPLIHRYWHDATVQMSDVKNEGVAASSSWGYMVNGLKADKQPVASTIPRASTPIAPTNGWTGRCSPRCRATWRRGSARCRWCRRRVRAVNCWGPTGARPTVSTCSTRSRSGARRRRKGASSCPIAAGPRTTSRSWAAVRASSPSRPAPTETTDKECV